MEGRQRAGSAAPEYLTVLKDGTVKQVNPFTGTRVWTVPGRAGRLRPAAPVEAAELKKPCPFCEKNYALTPPEKTRLVRVGAGWESLEQLPAERLFETTAEFRVIPNLFEILSFDYWHANYGYDLPPAAAEHRRAYLASPAGRAHVLAVQRGKLEASGQTEAEVAALADEAVLAQTAGLFGGGHDVIVARRHWADGADWPDGPDGPDACSQLAGSGTLDQAEHARYIALAVDSLRRLYDANPHVRYVAVFQNWLKPAGASLTHLHKQLVAIDEHGADVELSMARALADPNVFNTAGADYAIAQNLVIAENDAAVAYAGFGHRYPTVEVYSKSAETRPWRQTAAEIEGLSDLVHAVHAATGPAVPTNEEWHHQPPDSNVKLPWRINVKWRLSTPAGFEGGTKVYVNTVSPAALRGLLIPRLHTLRREGRLGPLRIGAECGTAPNPLGYAEAYS
ncbi:MAG: DUF4921 family protein [Propionibacteriaceae bacterium]|jgi:galactose-1-phosphate uridylyltransferase|nr:DUF4921 family protein [Propionibacteriaceae bacterium]